MRLRLIALGGTIAMNRGHGGLEPALSGQELAGVASSRLRPLADIDVESICNVPSAHLTLADVLSVARAIERASVDRDGVVVTVGTDALEEVALALDLLTSGAVPVVVTGAMRGSTDSGADGVRNLENAVRLVLAPQSRPAGVLVAFADEIHDPIFVQKTSTLRACAFASPGVGPLGYIVEGRVWVGTRRTLVHRLLPSSLDFVPAKVGLLTCALGSSELLQVLPHAALDGLVVAAFGGGHVPLDWIEPLGRLAEEMPVVLASRVSEGLGLRSTYAFAGSETDLLARRLIPAGILSPLKARLLLSFGVGLRLARTHVASRFLALQPG